MLAKIIEKAFKHTWWMVLFVLCCFAFYEQSQKKRDLDYSKLHDTLVHLQNEKKSALALQEDLFLQINSQSDPAWVELTLMKVLGLTPEGSLKIYFTPKDKHGL